MEYEFIEKDALDDEITSYYHRFYENKKTQLALRYQLRFQNTGLVGLNYHSVKDNCFVCSFKKHFIKWDESKTIGKCINCGSEYTIFGNWLVVKRISVKYLQAILDIYYKIPDYPNLLRKLYSGEDGLDVLFEIAVMLEYYMNIGGLDKYLNKEQL
jgi:hypothetical protein